jgi:aminoglycoside phosphotransferase (APT) family kinase protein
MKTAPNMDELKDRVSLGARRWSPGTRVVKIERLSGGASSLTYVAVLSGGDEREIVLKIAPAGLEPVRNRDVLRQSRVLLALSQIPGLPVPRVLFEDPGDPPQTPPFFAMELIDGHSYEPRSDGGVIDPPSATELEARLRHAARVLAKLHLVDPNAVGLSTEPVVTLADEVHRWGQAFAVVATTTFERAPVRLAKRSRPPCRMIVTR